MFSMLVGSIMVAIGAGIADLMLKNIVLSGTSRDSQRAFYAADGGNECTLFWDIQHEGFADTVFATSSASAVPASGVICNGQDIAQLWSVSAGPTSATTIFSLTLSGEVCATVAVEKTNSGADTKIESRGYNTCTVGEGRRLERAVRVRY